MADPIRSGLSLVGLALVAGCSGIGENETLCQAQPEACMSVREAYYASNGAAGPGSSGAGGAGPIPLGPIAGQPGAQPPRTDAVSLANGQAMRIWTAPYVDELGALHVSGYTFVEMQDRAWNVSQTDFYWTAR